MRMLIMSVFSPSSGRLVVLVPACKQLVRVHTVACCKLASAGYFGYSLHLKLTIRT